MPVITLLMEKVAGKEVVMRRSPTNAEVVRHSAWNYMVIQWHQSGWLFPEERYHGVAQPWLSSQ